MAETYISMRQFAKMAGVSPATVSHVFSNPESVAKDTVKHVLELAEHVGFLRTWSPRLRSGNRPGASGCCFRRFRTAISAA